MPSVTVNNVVGQDYDLDDLASYTKLMCGNFIGIKNTPDNWTYGWYITFPGDSPNTGSRGSVQIALNHFGTSVKIRHNWNGWSSWIVLK